MRLGECVYEESKKSKWKFYFSHFFATAKHESRDVEINTQRERDEIYKIEIFVVSCSLSQPQY